MLVKLWGDELQDFIASLETSTGAKVLRTIDLLERFGHQLGMPHSKRVMPSLFELRIRGRQEVRIFYTFSRGSAVLLHGYVKKSMPIPSREIATALRRASTLDTI